MSAQWKLTVVRAVCIGSGLCTGTAPRYFQLGPDRRSHPVSSLIDPDKEVLDVAISCPVEAITITESGGERSLFPEDDLDEASFFQQ
ncbi:MAG: ferredoxin [Pseudonocardiaceae bacterium]